MGSIINVIYQHYTAKDFVPAAGPELGDPEGGGVGFVTGANVLTAL